MKLIFLDQEPLTPRREKVFDIQALVDQGFIVEFWNLSTYCFRGVSIHSTLTKPYVNSIDTFEQFKKKVTEQDLSATIFIFEGYLASVAPWLNKYIRRLGGITVRYEINTTSKLPSKGLVKKVKKINRTFFRKLVHYVRQKWQSILYARPYTAVLSTGSIIEADIYVNHSDYIQYLETRHTPPLLPEPYIVFLDQFYPYHPDMACHGVNVQLNADAFFSDLNRYFDRIEAQMQAQVVIAAHPKAQYDPTTFNNRKIISGSSNVMVQHARGVIAISSASICFSVMHNKPLVLITTNDLQHSKSPYIHHHLNQYQKRLADLLSIPIQNISNSEDQHISISHIPQAQRQSYLYLYLTSPGIEDKYNTELLTGIYTSLLQR